MLRATTATFSDVFNGVATWTEAVRVGRHRGARGRRGWSGQLPSWFLWSPWAEVARERLARA